MQVEWKKLRDIFNRTLKKVVANGGSDSEITWRYWQKVKMIIGGTTKDFETIGRKTIRPRTIGQ